MGWWPALGSWLSLFIYSVFVVAQTAFIIVGNILLDSMMADVVEDSQVDTARRSEGLFFAARTFAMKAVSAGGIFGAGIVVSLVGFDGITGVEQVTNAMRLRLVLFYLPLIYALYFVGLYLLSRYRIDRISHEANLEELARREAAAAADG